MNEPEDPVATVDELLAQNVLFVSVTVHRWRGQYRLDGADVTVDNETVDKTVLADPRWKLMPATWNTRFGRIETAIRTLVGKRSLSFPIPGISVVPRLAAGDLFAAVDGVANGDLKKAVDEFVAEWPQLVAKLEATVPADLWPAVRAKLPASPDALRARFKVVKHVVPVGGFGAALTDDAATAYSKDIQKATADFVGETARTLADGLRGELFAAVDALTDRMTAKGVVKGANLDAVKAAFDKLEGFKFLASDDVLAKLAAARKAVAAADHESLNASTRHGDGSVAAALAAAVRSVTDGLSADVKFARFGRTKREVS